VRIITSAAFFAVSIAFLWYAVSAWRTDKLPFRTTPIYRNERPFVFWWNVVGGLIYATLMGAVAIFAISTHHPHLTNHHIIIK
jgi:hypothetical protein